MMPLDRANITVASRDMLPTYVGFFAGIGLAYMFTPLNVLRATPGLNYTDDLATLRLWGAAFFGAACFMVVAMIARRRSWYQAALAFCGVSMAVFAIALVLAAIFGKASPTAWIWPTFVVRACRATYKSLAAGEQ